MKNRPKKQRRRRQGRNITIPTHLHDDHLPEITRLEYLDLTLPDLSIETDTYERQVAVVASSGEDTELIRRLEERIKSKGYDVTVIHSH